MFTPIRAAALLAGILLAAPAHAEDSLEQAFGVGQFTGAATFCGIPRPDVLVVSKKLLGAFGIASDGPSPEMTKFTEGVAAGTTEMRGMAKPNCDEVKEAFADVQSRMK